jgi:hypothetical protein
MRRRLNPAVTLWALMWLCTGVALFFDVRPLVSFGAGCVAGVLFIWVAARVWE